MTFPWEFLPWLFKSLLIFFKKTIFICSKVTRTNIADILHKFDYCGIPGTTLNWILNILTNKTIKVVVNDTSLKSARVKSDVSQGSLSFCSRTPTFFTYINKLPSSHVFIECLLHLGWVKFELSSTPNKTGVELWSQLSWGEHDVYT